MKENLFEKTCIHHPVCAILHNCPLRSLYLSAVTGKFLQTRSAIDSNEEPRLLNRLERTSSVIGTLPLIASKIAIMQFLELCCCGILVAHQTLIEFSSKIIHSLSRNPCDGSTAGSFSAASLSPVSEATTNLYLLHEQHLDSAGGSH